MPFRVERLKRRRVCVCADRNVGGADRQQNNQESEQCNYRRNPEFHNLTS
jgi:hypothetical protein